MAGYVSLFRWTDDGIRTVKDTVTRARETIAKIEKAGSKLTIYWTQGRYDCVAFGEYPNEETAMSTALTMGMAGKVRTETLRAFSIDEMERILKRMT
jgi:uncharacterized protein with GYD domain